MTYRKTAFAAVLLIGASSVAAREPRGPMVDPFGEATVSHADAAAQATKQFDAIDTNHDGFLTEEEMDASGPFMSRMAQRADTNADDKLSKDEFAAAALQRFDMMDGDHNGQLTKAERDAARAEMRARMQQMQRDMGGAGGPGD